MGSIEFEVLGPVRLRRDADPAARLGRLQRTLLGVLLLQANRPVSADTLTEALWDGVQDDRTDQNLRLHVHRLRRTLGEASRLSYSPGGYQLRVLPDELDAERFETLVDEASQVAAQEPERCVDLVRKALGLWRGTPYEGLDVPMLADEAQRLVDRRLAATELLYEAELARGRDAVVVGDLTDLVRRHPLREHLHALLMIALYRAGRQAEALQVYQDARQALVDELGLEPGPELRSIEQQVLAGEQVGFAVRAEAARAVPAQLPTNVRGFVGRESELDALDRLLARGDDSVAIAVVAGTAGVGKTALALRWAHRARDEFSDGQLYVDLRGYGPDSPIVPDDALAGFLRALGVEGGEIPQDSAERAACFRSLLDGRRMLVVLDNARSVDQVRPLLPGSASCTVVITSRDSLAGLGVREGARRINLDRLSTGEASRLMVELLGEQRVDTEDLGQLIEQCARLPLALRIAADLVGIRPSRGVAGLVAELADEHDRLDLLDVEEDPHSAVRAVFSWSYQQLAPEAARLFRGCGLHPGREIDPYAVSALVGSDRRTTRDSVDRLVRAHLLEETGDGRFRLHDLLRAYAAELGVQVDADADRTAATTRLAEHYLHVVSMAMNLIEPREAKRRPAVAVPSTPAPRLSSYDDARDWLNRERSNLLALTASSPDSYLVGLSDHLGRYFEMGGYFDDALALHTGALELALRAGDERAEINARRLLSNVHYYLGSYDLAAEHEGRAVEICRGHGDPSELAAMLINLGSTERKRGNYDEALRHYEETMDLRGEYDDITLVSVLANTGSLLQDLGRSQEAVSHLEEALRIVEDDEASRGRLAAIKCHLVTAVTGLGEYERAIELGREALDLAREVGNLVVEADALNELGYVYQLQGNYDRSSSYLERSLDVARRAGHTAAAVDALVRLGSTYRLTGNVARAIESCAEALDLAIDTGQRGQQARAHSALADGYADLGELERAREHRERALELWSDLGVPEADEVRAKLDDEA